MVDVERSWVLRKWQQAPIPSSFSHPTVFKSIPVIAFRRNNEPKGRDSRTSCLGTRILDKCCLTHRQQFSMVYTLIDHRNDVKMFKTLKVEPRAAGEWFHCFFLNILTSFLRSIRVQTMENCCQFVFYNRIDSFCRPFPLTFRGKSRVRKRKRNYATITSFPRSVLLLTIALDQSAGEKSLSSCKKIIVTNYFTTLAKCSCYKNSHFLTFRKFRRFRGLQFHRLLSLTRVHVHLKYPKL